MTTTNSRKVLVPLATLLAAGAVAVGSGATWTSTTSSSVSVTSGTLMHTNSRDTVALTLSEIKPGDSMTGTVVVTNDGTIDSTLDLATSGVDSTLETDALTITVTADDGSGPVELYAGDFGAMAIDQQDVPFDVDDSITYTLTVALSGSATDLSQDKDAGATFTWTQEQVAGETLTELWS